MLASGERLSVVARAFGISYTTARQWCDPEYLVARKARAVDWMRAHPDRVAAIQRKRREMMTDEQRENKAAYQRQRYQTCPQVKATLKRLRDKYALTAQFSIGNRMRQMVLGWSDRLPVIHASLMLAVTGMSREGFTARYNTEGAFDHIIPLAAFDLTDPAHVVRANHPSNLRMVPAKVNNRKHAKHDCADVLALEWSGNPDALVQATSFISRQLANLARRQKIAGTEENDAQGFDMGRSDSVA